MRRINRGWFSKGPDSRRHRGRRRGTKNKPKTEQPYTCPHCYRPIGKWEPDNRVKRSGTAEAIKRMKQAKLIDRHRVPRETPGRFRRGVKDRARNRAGRPLGKPNSYPRVPSWCPECARWIEPEWRKVMVSRWKRSHLW